MTTYTYSADHETALAGGFDIVAIGAWVRPDSAAIGRHEPEVRGYWGSSCAMCDGHIVRQGQHHAGQGQYAKVDSAEKRPGCERLPHGSTG